MNWLKLICFDVNGVSWHILTKRIVDSGDKNLLIKFARELKSKLNWNEISKSENLDDDFITEFSDYINWDSILDNHNISISLFKKNFNILINLKQEYKPHCIERILHCNRRIKPEVKALIVKFYREHIELLG
jgi:hypothetical protein